ncbi:hypothetical protein EYF80_054841 [Liparis tanakae]|uniref:Uncharacterized protein n=1 Tax=Liparis tanakae TaxID=230148 RepID=A0A4Z2F1B7_9TELE|nr:hypothetical protein EYF80_054841 [Liparis tanakae]
MGAPITAGPFIRKPPASGSRKPVKGATSDGGIAAFEPKAGCCSISVGQACSRDPGDFVEGFITDSVSSEDNMVSVRNSSPKRTSL